MIIPMEHNIDQFYAMLKNQKYSVNYSDFRNFESVKDFGRQIVNSLIEYPCQYEPKCPFTELRRLRKDDRVRDISSLSIDDIVLILETHRNCHLFNLTEEYKLDKPFK